VVLGLVLVGALLLSFSKGMSLFSSTYELNLKANSVGGLKTGANVLLSGVVAGNVVGAEVSPEGRGVIIRAKIHERYQLYDDARFVIEQIGFLGDQFVAIYPQKNGGSILKDGDTVMCEEPLNIQEVVRTASGLMQQASQTVKLFNEAVARVDRTVLSEHSLSNVTATLANFRTVSEHAVTMVENIEKLVQTNSPPISISVSNLVRFSEDLEMLASEMTQAVITNRVELTKAVKNLEATTQVLQRLAHQVEAGKGLAGSLIMDDQLKINVSNTVVNLAILSSNLNKYGLLYKPRQPPSAGAVRSIYTGKTPFD